MPEKPFNELIKVIDLALQKNAGEGGFCFDDVKNITNLTALFKLFDRTEMVATLKKRAQKKGLKAKEWVPLVAQIDYMSSTERDIRLRFRNRIQALRLRDSNMLFARQGLRTFATEINGIESS